MLLMWIIEPLLNFARSILNTLPVADTAGLVEAVAPASRVIAWGVRMNAALPIAEVLAAFALVLGVYMALYGVMLVRRVFSLFWPGAGS